MFTRPKFKSPFAARCVMEEADIIEQTNDDGFVEEVAVPKKRASTKMRYLPGERLLKKLNQKKGVRKENRMNMDNIEFSLNNIIRDLA